jgi:hypothetical protein
MCYIVNSDQTYHSVILTGHRDFSFIHTRGNVRGVPQSTLAASVGELTEIHPKALLVLLTRDGAMPVRGREFDGVNIPPTTNILIYAGQFDGQINHR